MQLNLSDLQNGHQILQAYISSITMFGTKFKQFTKTSENRFRPWS
jgi:hypothetical protein